MNEPEPADDTNVASEPIDQRKSSILWQLVDGIYEFPWQPTNLRAWAGVASCLTLVALFACGLHALMGLLLQGMPEDAEVTSFGSMVYRGGAPVFVGLIVLGILFSLFPAACFLRAVEDSALGIEEVDWPRASWHEWVGKLVTLIWFVGVSAALAFPFVSLSNLLFSLSLAQWWATMGACVLLFFPAILLSALSGGAAWVIFDPRLIVPVKRRPLPLVVLYIQTVLFISPCVLVGHALIGHFYLWLIPVVGFVWATYLLCFARLLGRVAWIISRSTADSAENNS